MIYFNMKTSYGVETVDEINRADFDTYKEYSTEVRRLRNEYQLCGMNVYTSTRACKEWREG